MRSVHDRFWAKVDKSGDCWLWTASKSQAGYGVFGYNGKATSAHRVAYLLYVGDVPDDHHVHHSCGTRSCVRPSHLTSLAQDDHHDHHHRPYRDLDNAHDISEKVRRANP